MQIFFNAVRSRNGWSFNPTPRQFRYALKGLIAHAGKSIIVSAGANCQQQDKTSVMTISLLNCHKEDEDAMLSVSNNQFCDYESEESLLCHNCGNIIQTNTGENCEQCGSQFSINEDENLQELIDKKKMKQMQREIKLLEKRKQKMEKLYEKHCGKKYEKKEMVDEMEEVDESFDSLVKKVDKEKGYDKQDAKRVAGFIANRKRAGAGSGPTKKMKKREGIKERIFNELRNK